MNKPALIGLLFLALAVAVSESVLLQKAHARLTLAEQRHSSISEQIDALKKQISETQLPSSSSVTASIPDVTSLVQIARTSLEQTRNIQGLFTLLPEEQIPELSLLTDDEWLGLPFFIARHSELSSPDDYTRALSEARNKARRKFTTSLLGPALNKYLSASGNVLPPDTSALLPYFDRPIELAILARYEMVRNGSTNGLDPKADRVIVEKPSIADGPSDLLLERCLAYTHSVSSPNYRQRPIKSEVLTDLAAATMAFRRDHAGQDAATIGQLRPYLRNAANDDIDFISASEAPP